MNVAPDDRYLDDVLRDVVDAVSYKPGWQIYIGFELAPDGAGGWHLFIISNTEDSLNPKERMRVRHGFLIPPASYNKDSWITWVFNRCLDVERHECGEFFHVDGVRVFAPHHGNKEDPYISWFMSDYETAKKRAGDD